MTWTTLRLIKWCGQWLPKDQLLDLPRKIRGIYVLHKYRSRLDKYDVVYIGMTIEGGGVRSRLKRHKNSKTKGALWTHFSLFQVWDNINPDEIEELEGLFREIYRMDNRANKLNKQKKYGKLQKVICHSAAEWPREG